MIRLKMSLIVQIKRLVKGNESLLIQGVILLIGKKENNYPILSTNIIRYLGMQVLSVTSL